jgi:hypothetical protein
MIARLAGVFTICMLTTAAAMGPDVEVTPSREPHAASRLARDGDLQADGSQVVPGFPRALGLKKDYWWVVDVRASLVVSEWLEAAWAAVRSVLAHGRAWSRELLFSWDNQMPRSGHYKPSLEHGRRPITMIAKSTKFTKEGFFPVDSSRAS